MSWLGSSSSLICKLAFKEAVRRLKAYMKSGYGKELVLQRMTAISCYSLRWNGRQGRRSLVLVSPRGRGDHRMALDMDEVVAVGVAVAIMVVKHLERMEQQVAKTKSTSNASNVTSMDIMQIYVQKQRSRRRHTMFVQRRQRSHKNSCL